MGWPVPGCEMVEVEVEVPACRTLMSTARLTAEIARIESGRAAS